MLEFQVMQPGLARPRHLNHIAGLLQRFPVVALVGPRQVGKSTLALQVGQRLQHGLSTAGPVTRFDLEDPRHLARFADPMLTLEPLRGLVILDEIQRVPELFQVLRVLADRPGHPAHFLVLGSASPALLRQGSESLAGRLAVHRLPGLDLDEVGVPGAERLWLRGGFPRAWLAATDADAAEWNRAFLSTFVERDLPSLGVRLPAEHVRRFWAMLAHWHGNLWNGAELARAFGLSESTVRRYLDTLVDAMVVQTLPPWHENLAKRQVKAPKVYVADTGLLHALLGLESMAALLGHPKVGASWEGWALHEVQQCLGVRPGEAWFWATHGGAELDLLVMRGGTRLGFEVKRTSSPRVTASMRAAMADLRLDRLDVVYAGREVFALAERIRAVPAAAVWQEVAW